MVFDEMRLESSSLLKRGLRQNMYSVCRPPSINRQPRMERTKTRLEAIVEYWEFELEADRNLAEREFARSAELYEKAISLLPRDHPQRPYVLKSLFLGLADALLGARRPSVALDALERLAVEDPRGVYASYTEYWSTLAAVHRELGNTEETEHALQQEREVEISTDWLTPLKEAEKLLAQRRYRESLELFERSIRANPGEAGTASALQAAEDGRRKALEMLKRQRH